MYSDRLLFMLRTLALTSDMSQPSESSRSSKASATSLSPKAFPSLFLTSSYSSPSLSLKPTRLSISSHPHSLHIPTPSRLMRTPTCRAALDMLETFSLWIEATRLVYSYEGVCNAFESLFQFVSPRTRTLSKSV